VSGIGPAAKVDSTLILAAGQRKMDQAKSPRHEALLQTAHWRGTGACARRREATLPVALRRQPQRQEEGGADRLKLLLRFFDWMIFWETWWGAGCARAPRARKGSLCVVSKSWRGEGGTTARQALDETMITGRGLRPAVAVVESEPLQPLAGPRSVSPGRLSSSCPPDSPFQFRTDGIRPGKQDDRA
jgi:hypothetical protein